MKELLRSTLVCPQAASILSSGESRHIGYAYVALYMFLPFALFYFWAARYERHRKHKFAPDRNQDGRRKPDIS